MPDLVRPGVAVWLCLLCPAFNDVLDLRQLEPGRLGRAQQFRIKERAVGAAVIALDCFFELLGLRLGAAFLDRKSVV